MTFRTVLAVIVVVLGCVAVAAQVPTCVPPASYCKYVDVLACGLCSDGAGGTTDDTCAGPTTVSNPDCTGIPGSNGDCAGRCENSTATPCLFDVDCASFGGGVCKKSTGGNGTATNPFCRIQDAYDLAKNENPNLTWDILVEQGTYQECVTAWGFVADVSGFWDSNASTDFAVRLSALEYLRTGANDESTVINGTGECDSAVPAPAEPGSTVKIGGTGTELKGFTITGGGKSGVFAQGDVVITNNVIRGNDGDLGGGIYLLTASCYYPDNTEGVSALIADNLIEDNHSKAPPTASTFGCEFCVLGSAPCGTGDGGGIFAVANDRGSCGTNDEVTVSDNIVRNNTAENFNWDPCSAVCEGSDPLVVNCADPAAPDCPLGSVCEEQQTYTSNGGGIFALTDSSVGTAAKITITQNVIAGNAILLDSSSYYGEGYGGGVYAVSFGYGFDTIDISDNCIGGTDINDCLSDATSGNYSTLDGGGISARARPLVDGRHTMTIDRNTVTGNLADRDGGGLELLIEATEFSTGASNDRVQLDMSRNLVTGNEANRDGGGLKAVSDIRRTTLADADALLLAIHGNVIDNNTSGLGAGGALLQPIADADDFVGGICGVNPAPAESRIDFVENLVTDNFATADDPGVDVIGGGVLALPLTFGDATATVMIDQTTVSGNEIGPEGLVSGVEGQAVTYVDCLTGLDLGVSQLIIDRTIVSDNTCTGSGQCAGVGGPPQGIDVLIASATNCNVFGHSPNYESTIYIGDPPPGNLTGDPLLDAQYFPDACSPVFDRFCQAPNAPATSCVDDSGCSQATCSPGSFLRTCFVRGNACSSDRNCSGFCEGAPSTACDPFNECPTGACSGFCVDEPATACASSADCPAEGACDGTCDNAPTTACGASSDCPRLVCIGFCEDEPTTSCASNLDCPSGNCITNDTCESSELGGAPCTDDTDCSNGICDQRCIDAVGYYGNPDSTGDGVVDGREILGIAASFGATLGVDNRYDEASDLNRNAMNDGDDLSRFTSDFGQVCEP